MNPFAVKELAEILTSSSVSRPRLRGYLRSGKEATVFPLFRGDFKAAVVNYPPIFLSFIIHEATKRLVAIRLSGYKKDHDLRGSQNKDFGSSSPVST